MFLQSNPESVNQVSSLKVGIYRCQASLYQSADFGSKAVFLQYAHEQEKEISVVELLVISPDGRQYLSDYVRLHDGAWRDSSGVLAPSVGELYPPEIIDFKLFDECRLADQFVGN